MAWSHFEKALRIRETPESSDEKHGSIRETPASIKKKNRHGCEKAGKPGEQTKCGHKTMQVYLTSPQNNTIFAFGKQTFMELQLIQNKIYEIRGQRVMLDFDLANLYAVETKRLKEAVRRNTARFPDDFMFELNSLEWKILRTQFATSSWGGTRYPPFAFTEQGVAMLASVLKSETAIQVNIQIVRAFIALRQFAIGYTELNRKLEDFMLETNLQFNDIYQALAEMASLNSKQNETKKIGYLTIKEEN